MYIFRQSPPKRKNRGRVTIVAKFHNGALFIAASKNHSSLDNFDKQEGRWRALERLIKGEFLAIEVMENCDGKKFLKHAMQLAKMVSNGTIKPVMHSGIVIVKPFKLKDFLNSPIVPQNKKDAYLRHQQNNEAPNNTDLSIPSVH